MKLRITLPDEDPYEVEASKDQLTLGRASDCDVVIASPFVSKAHLRLYRGLVALDLGSSNGTFLAGGKRVEGASLVSDGQLTIGPEDIRIEVLDQGASSAEGDDGELRKLQAVVSGLEVELEQKRNENDYLRVQVESLRKADATREAVEQLSKAHLRKQGINLDEFDRLTSVYAEVLEKLQADIETRVKKPTTPY